MLLEVNDYGNLSETLSANVWLDFPDREQVDPTPPRPTRWEHECDGWANHTAGVCPLSEDGTTVELYVNFDFKLVLLHCKMIIIKINLSSLHINFDIRTNLIVYISIRELN